MPLVPKHLTNRLLQLAKKQNTALLNHEQKKIHPLENENLKTASTVIDFLENKRTYMSNNGIQQSSLTTSHWTTYTEEFLLKIQTNFMGIKTIKKINLSYTHPSFLIFILLIAVRSTADQKSFNVVERTTEGTKLEIGHINIFP